eukprot:3716016-Rhodomonas_salina.2
MCAGQLDRTLDSDCVAESSDLDGRAAAVDAELDRGREGDGDGVELARVRRALANVLDNELGCRGRCQHHAVHRGRRNRKPENGASLLALRAHDADGRRLAGLELARVLNLEREHAVDLSRDRGRDSEPQLASSRVPHVVGVKVERMHASNLARLRVKWSRPAETGDDHLGPCRDRGVGLEEEHDVVVLGLRSDVRLDGRLVRGRVVKVEAELDLGVGGHTVGLAHHHHQRSLLSVPPHVPEHGGTLAFKSKRSAVRASANQTRDGHLGAKRQRNVGQERDTEGVEVAVNSGAL